jgi:DNA-binding response OmpR family regulator
MIAIGAANQSGRHLLVVDDDIRLRRLLQRYLTEHGYHVTAAADAAEAKAALKNFAFDLMVLDVMMPGQDGISLVKELRTGLDMPILLLTALGETENRVNGLSAGADDYLAKPFDPRELLLRIATILRRRPTSRSDSGRSPSTRTARNSGTATIASISPTPSGRSCRSWFPNRASRSAVRNSASAVASVAPTGRSTPRSRACGASSSRIRAGPVIC